MKYRILYIIASIFVFWSCNPSVKPSAGRAVSVSILPQKCFVEAIAGNSIKVNVMIPPGASHSSYEPTARQMNLLVNSQAYLKIGHLDFELSWMPRFEGTNPSMKVFDLSEGIDLISGGHDHHGENSDIHIDNEEKGIDPHTWMSPRNVKIIASNILKSLSKVYPEDSTLFRKNYNYFVLQVDSVEQLFNMSADKLKGSAFIIYHPALAYLARDYGMEQVVLEFDGKEPPPAHIKEIIDLAKEKNIRTVFVQRQFSIDNSRSLAKEINATIIPIDPMDENWKSQMISILNLLLANRKAEN
jgi:zinc transport system substrate-binding protein